MTNEKNVTASKPKIGGAISVAPVGTPLPIDAKAKLNDAFKSLGYVSEDGTENENSFDSDTIKAWGGDTVLNVDKGKEDTFKFTLIESLNVDVLKTIYGDSNVTGDLVSGIKISNNNTELPNKSYVIDMILKGNILKRIVIPSAKITELETVTYKDDEAVGYGITLSANADETGNMHYEYIIKG